MMTDYYRARARLASALTNLVAHLERHGVGRATKSINEVTREYSDLLLRLIVDAGNGNLTVAEFRRAMFAGLREDAQAVYYEGMREGGIKDPEAEADDEDKLAIDSWVDAQAEYLSGFAADAVAVAKIKDSDEREAARNEMLRRRDLWVQSLAALGRLGYASAKANTMGTWRMGRTEEHCDTCRSLHGKRKRVKWFVSNGYIPQEPGSDTLECGGWECQCGVYDDDGKRIL